MFHIFKSREKVKMPTSSSGSSPLMKPLSAIAGPGMYLFYKYNEFKRQQQENHRKKVTEKELDHLNNKIDKLLARIEDKDGEVQSSEDEEEECVICMSAKASITTYPCSHRVLCRKCFIKTIQVAVTQRCLPLKCVLCRTRVLKLRQSSSARSKAKAGSSKVSRPGPRHRIRCPKPVQIYPK